MARFWIKCIICFSLLAQYSGAFQNEWGLQKQFLKIHTEVKNFGRYSHQQKQWISNPSHTNKRVISFQAKNDDPKYVRSKGSNQRGNSDFEKQELMILLRKMDVGNVAYQELSPSQREGIVEYLEAILNGPEGFALVALPEIPQLMGRWKMIFSTDDLFYNLLPVGTKCYIDILSGPGRGNLNYRFLFPERSWLKDMVAESEYTIDRTGMLAFSFKAIKSKLFGFQFPIPFGEMGNSFVDICYFDGNIMIEKLEKRDPKTDLLFDSYTVYLYDGPIEGSFAQQ
mmetsp:Transcript_38997/g.51425  ORF Transcript_38997/g.51425 Transcript_38997/m.51425 type:complete len:283 (+) Transcript_38997:220-1068(+)